MEKKRYWYLGFILCDWSSLISYEISLIFCIYMKPKKKKLYEFWIE